MKVPPPSTRPKAASAFMAVPVLFAAGLGISLITLIVMGKMGSQAAGERVVIQAQSTCAQSASEVVRARADAIGLGEPEMVITDDGFHLTATMPGLADDQKAIPALLTRTGNLSIRANQTVLATREDLVQATLLMDESGNPATQVQLSETAMERIRAAVTADPDGEIRMQLDQNDPVIRPNSIAVDGSLLRLTTGLGSPAERMRIATDRAIVLQYGPMPCLTTVTAVDLVPSSG